MSALFDSLNLIDLQISVGDDQEVGGCDVCKSLGRYIDQRYDVRGIKSQNYEKDKMWRKEDHMGKLEL